MHATLELQGTYNNIPVIFRISNNFDINAEIPTITIKDGTNYTALTVLHLSLLYGCNLRNNIEMPQNS